jgi:hypothetical protein
LPFADDEAGLIGDLIKELIPDVQVLHRGDDVDARNYRVSFAKTCTERSRSIRKHLGFTPRRTVADGVTSTGSVQAWRSKPPSKMAASPTIATLATATSRPSPRLVLSRVEGKTTSTSSATPA